MKRWQPSRRKLISFHGNRGMLSLATKRMRQSRIDVARVAPDEILISSMPCSSAILVESAFMAKSPQVMCPIRIPAPDVLIKNENKWRPPDLHTPLVT